MTDRNDSIDKIVEDIKTNFTSDGASSRHKLEFTLVDEGEGLSFEEAEAAPVVSEPPTVAQEQVIPEQPPVAPKEEKRSETASIWTTYVPRFTEVSDNYRMGKSLKSEAPSATKVEAVKEELKPSEVAPTAEIDNIENTEGVRHITVGAPPEENYDIQATVFKFEVPDEPAVVTASVEEQVVEKEEAEPVEEAVCVEGPKEYSIPDPEHRPFSEMGLTPVSPIALELPATRGELKPVSRFSEEYTSFAARDSFKDKFLDTVMSVKVRLFTALAVFVLTFVLELLTLLKVDVAAFLGFSAVFGALAVIDAIFVTCLFLLAVPETVYAVRSAVRGRAVPELFVPVSYAVVMAYYVTVASLASSASYSLFGVMFALVSVGSIVATLYRKVTEFSAFKVVAGNTEKTVIDKRMTRSLPEESIAVDGKVEGYKSKLARTCRASFISDFFGRTAKFSENSRNVLIVLGAAIGAALVSGLVAFFLLEGVVSLLSTFATVFMLAFPVIMLLSHKLPYFYAEKEVERDGAAIIGEAALYDHAGVDVLCFEDTEVFNEEDVNLQRIMLYGRSENLTKALRQMSSLFSVVGGPLEHIFADSLDRLPTPAVNVTVEEEGITGESEGHSVMAGSLEFMVRKGIGIPADPTQEKALLSTKVMYAAEDGQVYAKFYIRYTLSEEFTMMLPSLCDDGILPLIYTRDPNVNNELFRTLTAGSDSIRVFKKNDLPTGNEPLYERASAGIATVGDKSSLINALFACKRYASLQSRIAFTELLAMIVGAVLAVVLALAGITVIPSVVLGLWQVAWCGALLFLSKRTFNTKKDKENK